METLEELTARNKAIDEYNSRRNRLFGKALYFASHVKMTIDAHEKADPENKTGSVTIFKDSVETLKDLANEIAKEESEMQAEFERIFMAPYLKKDGKNG